MQQQAPCLQAFFRENPRVALAFSGGVDSSYLLYAGLRYGADIRPYYVKTAFQPQFELDDALRLAAQLGTTLTVVRHNILSVPDVATNPANRCYYCKSALFGLLRERAAVDGYSVLIDGTNASDDAGDRPHAGPAGTFVRSFAGVRHYQERGKETVQKAGCLPGTNLPTPALPLEFRPECLLRRNYWRGWNGRRMPCLKWGLPTFECAFWERPPGLSWRRRRCTRH